MWFSRITPTFVRLRPEPGPEKRFCRTFPGYRLTDTIPTHWLRPFVAVAGGNYYSVEQSSQEDSKRSAARIEVTRSDRPKVAFPIGRFIEAFDEGRSRWSDTDGTTDAAADSDAAALGGTERISSTRRDSMRASTVPESDRAE